MKTNLYPDSSIWVGDKELSGFFVGRIFVPCSGHNGSVTLIPTHSGKGCGYRLVQSCGDNFGEYHQDHYGLEIRSINYPVTSDEVYRVAASCGQRLVVTNLQITENKNHGKTCIVR